MLINIVKWVIGLSIGITLYIYDDFLWGPLPIGLATKLFDWPRGIIGLSIVYFFISFFVALLILKHYQTKKKASGKNWLVKQTHKRRGTIYKLLLSGRWLGLALACFTFGAILTSLVVGKYKLFSDINVISLALIMSSLFVFLFMGFYGGIFSVAIQEGWLAAGILIIAFSLFFKLAHSMWLQSLIVKGNNR